MIRMKLFTKTLLLFISIIIIQSSLTIIFITNIVKNSNLIDSRKELRIDANEIFENYHSWKRSIWKNLISIMNNEELINNFTDKRDIYLTDTFINNLKEMLLVSGIDIIILRSNTNPHSPNIIQLNKDIGFFVDINYYMNNRKPHPYIELKLISNYIYLIGTIRLFINTDSFIDIFILKRIDDAFCTQLTHYKRSRVVFFLEQKYIIGTFNKKSLVESLNLNNIDTVYSEYYNMEIDNKMYNISAKKIDKLQENENKYNLYLITVLSNTPYTDRLILINNTLLYVSLLSALLTIILSLFLSRNITKPVQKLYFAMQRIQNGEYAIKVNLKTKNEFGDLFQGFNDMALQLNQDKIKMSDYIHEITMLKDYNEKIIHSIRAGIAIINSKLILEKANRFFIDCFNLDAKRIIGKRIENLNIDIFDESITKNIQEVIKRNKEYISNIKKRSKNNRIFEIRLYPLIIEDEEKIKTFKCVFIVDDISKTIEFEEKIFQAEKLSSISMLSAGVAHEINNPLSSIMVNAQNLIEDEQDIDKKISLRWIEQETRRIAKIIQELLDFSSSSIEKNQGSYSNKVITEVINLINYSLKKEKKIKIKTKLEQGIPAIVISEDKLKQIIINLVKNSIQAIDKDGTICIITHWDKRDGRIYITVEDNGHGIKEKIITRIFDPFFTTKYNGEGTGLGLSIVYGIINKYNGKIKIKTKQDKGTSIKLIIPILK